MSETRERLLESAAEQFNQAGYFGTDTNRIARGAGLAPGSFYRHFPDKKAIFLEIYAKWVDTQLGGLAGIPPGPSRAREIVALVVGHHRRWSVFRASLQALVATDPEVRAARLESRQRQVEALVRLQRGLDPGRALFLLWSFERVADGIAQGEAEAVGVDEAGLLAHLAALLSG